MFSSDLIRRAEAGPALGPILVFDILIGVAFVILLVSVLVAWLSGLNRMKTWYLLLLSSAGYCLSFLLLVGQQTGPEPPLHFCALSAALIYSAPPMVAAAALFFVIELHLRLSSVLFSRSMSDKFIYWVAWGIPISHGLAFWVALLTGLSNSSKVKRDPSGVYCHLIDTRHQTLLTATLVVLFLGAMLILEVFTVVHLIRERAAIRNIRLRGSDFPLHLFIRTFIYSISGGFGIIMVTVLLNTTDAVAVNLLAVIPLSVALVFGSQTDLLRALFRCQCRRSKPGVQPLPPQMGEANNPV